MVVRKMAITGWLILFSYAIIAQETPFISHFSRNDYLGLNQNWSLSIVSTQLYSCSKWRIFTK